MNLSLQPILVFKRVLLLTKVLLIFLTETEGAFSNQEVKSVQLNYTTTGTKKVL